MQGESRKTLKSNGRQTTSTHECHIRGNGGLLKSSLHYYELDRLEMCLCMFISDQKLESMVLDKKRIAERSTELAPEIISGSNFHIRLNLVSPHGS